MYLKYLSFEVYAFDLGTFQQSLYTTIFSHRWFLDNPDMITFYGSHPQGYVSLWNILFSPFMLLLLPEYALFPSPLTLFLIQALAISSSSILLRELSTEELGEAKARTLSYLWFAYPFTYFSGMYDFHLESFIPFFTFLVILAIRRGGRWFRVGSLLVYLTVIKATPFLMIALMPWLYKSKMLERSLKYLFASVFFAFFDVFMERLPYDGEVPRFYVLGVKVPPLSVDYLFHYIPALLSFFAPQLALAIVSWFVGVLFLPLDSLSILPALLWMGGGLATGELLYVNGFWQYGNVILPFIFLGVMDFATKHNFNLKYLIPTSLVTGFMVLIISFHFGVGLITTAYSLQVPHVTEENLGLDSFLSKIPGNASLQVSSSVFPHVADDPNTYLVTPPWVEPEYVVSNMTPSSHAFQHLREEGYVVIYNASNCLVMYHESRNVP